MIDPKYLDVSTIGEGQAMGCLPRDDTFGSEWSVFEDSIGLVPREDWRELAEHRVDMERLVSKVKNQGREGSCTSNATVAKYEHLRATEFGRDDWVEMSAMSVYKRVGRSAGSGSSISANMRELVQRGILPADTPANRERFNHVHPHTGFSNRLPNGWEETAAHFRVSEWYDIGSFTALVSALLLGYAVVYGRASHAILGIRPVYDDGKWFVKYINSWGSSWGDWDAEHRIRGYGYDSERYLTGPIKSYGAFAARLSIDSPLARAVK